MNKRQRILPGSTIGVLGSGQLGRMMALAAREMGYRVHTYSPDSDSPTGQVADKEVVGKYDDLEAIRKFAQGVDVITFEFENVPSATADAAAEIVPVRPRSGVLHITQHRLREKTFLSENGFPVAPFWIVNDQNPLSAISKELDYPVVMKTAGFGYDGKGQVVVGNERELETAYRTLGSGEVIVESFIDFRLELSVVAARDIDGAFAHWGPIRNAHRHHILDVSSVPSGLAPEIEAKAVLLTRRIAEKLDVVGVFCVEFFLTKEGELLVNEMAPRPHNSGHLTIDAYQTSQFEQQVRAVCGLPLGPTSLLRPAAMANLLGDIWQNGEPGWRAALVDSAVKLHLYGKTDPRPGRKMGHLTALAETAEAAIQKVTVARERLETGRDPEVAAPTKS